MTILLYRVFLSSLSLIAILFVGFNLPLLAVSQQDNSDLFNTGINHLHQQNYQQAVVDFTEVIEHPNNLIGAAYSNRCLANLQLQNYMMAEVDCLAAIQDNNNNIEAYLNLGLVYYQQEKYYQAIAQYQQIIKQESQDYRAYYNRGLAYFALNNYQQAIVDYQTALATSPDSFLQAKSLIYNDLAITYLMLGENKSAISNFEQAIALDGNNYDAYFNRGCAHHRQGQYHASIADFSQVVQLQPNFTQAYVNRAVLYHQIGEKKAAFKDINLALQQYKNQGDHLNYEQVSHLQQQLFYAQPNQIA